VHPSDPTQNLVTEYLDVNPLTGLPGGIKDPENKISRFTYDAYGQVRTATDPLGHSTVYDYDPPTGNLRSVQAPATAPTAFRYDDRGLVTQSTVGSGTTAATTTYHYDAVGRLDYSLSPTGVRRDTAYDANGNRRREST